MKRIALIGSTGSIGRQVINVCKRYPDKFKIISIVAGGNARVFSEQIKDISPLYFAMSDEEAAKKVAAEFPDVKAGQNACLAAIEREDIDVAFIAASGFAGLEYSLKAIECKKSIALANKETLVVGGEIVMPLIRKNKIELMPVDSEHSALWQALSFRLDAPFKKLIITASGGPFYSLSDEELERVTAKDALKHPTWQMGAKITVDSATLLNKGFEVIEAKWLYSTSLDKIQTVVHPQSIIHSMVEFEDGAVMAQMSYPTMELPIQLALTYPERMNVGIKSLDFCEIGSLRFMPLERKRFTCYDLALKSCESGGIYPCALNGAGEVAVAAFLNGRIGFKDIGKVIEKTLSSFAPQKAESFEILKETDAKARTFARGVIGV